MNRALAEFCASPLEYDLHEMVDDEDMLEIPVQFAKASIIEYLTQRYFSFALAN